MSSTPSTRLPIPCPLTDSIVPRFFSLRDNKGAGTLFFFIQESMQNPLLNPTLRSQALSISDPGSFDSCIIFHCLKRLWFVSPTHSAVANKAGVSL